MKLIFGQKQLNPSGFGDCYIQTNKGTFFPDEQWEDFCLYMLNGWLADLIASKMLQKANFSLCFMDGPYCLLCQKEGSGVTIQGMKEEAASPLFTERMEYDALLKLVYDAGHMVLEKMQAKGVCNRDVAALGEYLK